MLSPSILLFLPAARVLAAFSGESTANRRVVNTLRDMSQADEGWDDFLASLGAVDPVLETENGAQNVLPASLADEALLDLGEPTMDHAAQVSDPFAGQGETAEDCDQSSPGNTESDGAN